jgi:uncharacterized protein YbaP (TraB family)
MTYLLFRYSLNIEYPKSEVEAMQHQENKLISEVNNLNNHLTYLQSLKQSYSESCSRLRQNVEYLENKQKLLETFIETYKRTDKKYYKIKKIAELESLFTINKKITIRWNRRRFRGLYINHNPLLFP